MTHLLEIPCDTEVRMARDAEFAAKKLIDFLGEEESARRLDLAPAGLRALVWQRSWSLSRGLRVISALGENE